MSRRIYAFAAAAVATPLALTAQSTVQAASTVPPTLAAPKALTLPKGIERTLPNGLKLVFVEQHEIPVVDVSLVVRTGAEADPQGKEGLATLTADLLDEGAGTRDALALADQIGFLAVRLGTGAGFESSSISLHTARTTLDSAMSLMADVVMRPTFPDKEFTRLREQWSTSLLQEKDRGPAMADRAFAALLYTEKHPYGRSARGTTESAKIVTLDDAKKFWSSWYRPNNATMVIVGDLSLADAEALVNRAFGSWTQAPLPPKPVYASTKMAPKPTTIYIVDKPKAAQSSFRVGSIGVARSTADYFPLTVLNTALGGSFTARLNNTLREQKGYTYGASSRFTMRREAGPFVASAEVVSAKTDSAMITFMDELNGIRKPMPAAELAKTKKYLQLGYADRFESTSDIAGQIASLVPYNLPLSTLSAFDAGIGAVTAADVQKAANKYLDPQHLTIVIAGDRATIEAGLKATKIGPVELRDARGRPVITP